MGEKEMKSSRLIGKEMRGSLTKTREIMCECLWEHDGPFF